MRRDNDLERAVASLAAANAELRSINDEVHRVGRAINSFRALMFWVLFFLFIIFVVWPLIGPWVRSFLDELIQ